MSYGDTIKACTAALAEARHVAVLTGAGVSAESGVPTFRDALQGLWAKHDPMQLATPDAFLRDPQTAWDWYRWRRSRVADVAPNPGHDALVALAEHVDKLTLVTQNVDGLHQRAGSRDVIEFHGNLFSDKCAHCDTREPAHNGAAGDPPPICGQCGRVMTPGVVLFGEMIPSAAMQASEVAATTCDLFLVVGTSAQVYPAAGLVGTARAYGAGIIEINPEATPLSAGADHVLRGPSGEVLPALLEALAA
ncbi:MAG: NAD-dependent deacylase [Pseudomonadota bacterium]